MKVFISYIGKDGALAKEVVVSLEDAGLDAWYDKREILPGDNWAEKISEGLKESDAMVVLLTPDALESVELQRNIEYALGSKAYNKRLFPILVGDAADFSSSEIPWIFKHLKTIKLSGRDRNEGQFKQIAEAIKAAA
jgi:hypothetical protein